LKRIWAGASLIPALGHALYVRAPVVPAGLLVQVEQRCSEIEQHLEEVSLARLREAEARIEIEVLAAEARQHAEFLALDTAMLHENLADMEAIKVELSASRNQIADLHGMLKEQANVNDALRQRCSDLEDLLKQAEESEKARKAAALEDFRLARVQARREAARERVHAQTLAELEEKTARLACLHEALDLVSVQMNTLELLTAS